jgi:hypothetical protein
VLDTEFREFWRCSMRFRKLFVESAADVRLDAKPI